MHTRLYMAVGPGPVISISVVPSKANPAPGGANYNLTCNVSGVNASLYQWRKNDSIIEGKTTKTLSFSPLKLSDTGLYKCGYTQLNAQTSLTTVGNAINVTVRSKNTDKSHFHNTLYADYFHYPVPDPTVLVQSNPVSPIHPVGLAVTLTCTVELSPAVDISVAVYLRWLGPVGFFAEDSGIVQPVMGSTATYTSTAMVNSFGREKSGIYRCIVLINSTSHDQLMAGSLVQSIGLGHAQITTGKSHKPCLPFHLMFGTMWGRAGY